MQLGSEIMHAVCQARTADRLPFEALTDSIPTADAANAHNSSFNAWRWSTGELCNNCRRACTTKGPHHPTHIPADYSYGNKVNCQPFVLENVNKQDYDPTLMQTTLFVILWLDMLRKECDLLLPHFDGSN